MDKKPTASPEVEAIRQRLKEMGRPGTLELAGRLGLIGITLDKFRRGHITNLSADKYLVLKSALEGAADTPCKSSRAAWDGKERRKQARGG
jgi:hypothetical protein